MQIGHELLAPVSGQSCEQLARRMTGSPPTLAFMAARLAIGESGHFLYATRRRARADNIMPSADHVEWSGPLRVARPRDAVHVPRLRS
jgi:hypothetical protein